MMSLNIYTFILSTALVLVLGDLGANKTDMQPFKDLRNCHIESIYYAANFLTNKCRYVSTAECHKKFAACAKTEKRVDVIGAIDKCAEKLRRSANEIIMQACNTTASVYRTTLQAVCCVKTELKIATKKDLRKIEGLLESCYDKEGCGRMLKREK